MTYGTLSRWSLWGGALLALPLAYLLRNPLLLLWFGIATPLLCLVTVAALLYLRTQRKRSAPPIVQGYALMGLWLSALVLVCAQEGIFHWRKHQVMHSPTDVGQTLGSHIIIG